MLSGLSSCIVNEDPDKSIYSQAEPKINSVKITGRSYISYDETVSFRASVNTTGNPTLTYLWNVTQGSDYVVLSDTVSKKITVQANNSTASEQIVELQLTVSDGTNTLTDSHKVTLTENGVQVPAELIPMTTDTVFINLTDGTVSGDDSSWETIGIGSSGEVVFSDEAIVVKYTKDDNDNSTGLIKIDASDFDDDFNVKLTGTTETGGVKIQTNANYKTFVYLNGVTIKSSDYPCLDITKGGSAEVYIEGENILVDGRVYGTGYGEEYTTSSGTYKDDDGNIVACTLVKSVVKEGSDNKGTLYCKGDLTVSGSGSLTITQAYKNCIASKANLTINSGTYNITSNGKNGICGDKSVTINDGTITFNGTGSVSSSSFRKTNAIKTDTDDSSSAIYIKGGNLNLTAYNGKGISASKVYISGGTSILNITGVSNFTNDNRQTATYYDADGVKYSNVSVTFAAEGIEGASVIEITGGSVSVSATDDGLNVSDFSGNFYMKSGSLYCYAEKGDGVDCNGSVYVSGGVIVSYAPTGSEDALDFDDRNGSINISGGIIAGTCGSSNAVRDMNVSGQKLLYFTGSSGGMGGGPGGTGGPEGGGGPGGPGGRGDVSYDYGSSSTSFSKIAVKLSGSDEYVFAYELPSSSFGVFYMTSPAFTESSASMYSVYSNPTFTAGATTATGSGSADFHGLYAVGAENTVIPAVSGGTLITPVIK